MAGTVYGGAAFCRRCAGTVERAKGNVCRRCGGGLPRVTRRASNARMTAETVAAAYRAYRLRRLSLRQLSEELWREHGFPNAEACATSLRRAFHKEGYPLRDAIEASRRANSTAGGRSRHADPEVRNAYQREYRRRLKRATADRRALREPMHVAAASAHAGARLRDHLARQGWLLSVGPDPRVAEIEPARAGVRELLRTLADFAAAHSEALQIRYRATVWLLRPERLGSR